MVGDHEVAGAIPATQTTISLHATVPRNGTRFCEDRRRRFNSSRWHHSWHASTRADPTRHLPVKKVSLKRKSLVVRALGCELENSASPSGTRLASKTGRAAFDSLVAC